MSLASHLMLAAGLTLAEALALMRWHAVPTPLLSARRRDHERRPAEPPAHDGDR